MIRASLVRGFLLFILLFLQSHCLIAQSGEWIWVKGNNTPNSAGTYGAQGVPSLANNPPGLYEATEWTDSSGNFWLFGGNGVGFQEMSALWKYDSYTNMWTWMKGPNVPNQTGVFGIKGISDSLNYPGARGFGSIGWIGSNRTLWLFGGSGLYGYQNDLWKYDISTNEWTWISGSDTVMNIAGVYGIQGVPSPANYPGGRNESAASWVDEDGNLWLFGGAGMDVNGNYGDLNDLWKFDVVTLEWTWMKGSNTVGSSGSYGTLGIAHINNNPSGRFVYCKWKDRSGKFWLFGGSRGIGGNPVLSDVWKFDPSNSCWTWMDGPNVPSDSGYYDSACIVSTLTFPRARTENRVCWTDTCDGLWMFGGNSFFSIGSIYNGIYNDLWRYDYKNYTWLLINGSSFPNQHGVYGAIGVPSLLNIPGSRNGANAFKDKIGDLWLFGGDGYGASTRGLLNDLWKFVPDSSCGACDLFTSTPEMDENISIIIFPNPANLFLTVSIHLLKPQPIEIQIFNSLGEKMSYYSEPGVKNEFQKMLNVETFQNGIYLFQIITGQKSIVKTFVVQHE